LNEIDTDYPRSLREKKIIEQRRSMLSQPHIAPLAAYVDRLRAPSVYVPEFDPMDGGLGARILFLFEKPGPKTDPSNGGSGFISRDNDDPTAEAIYSFMREAGLPRRETILWNFVPWWNGSRKLIDGERQAAAGELRNLLTLLPKVDTAVLVGITARAAEPSLPASIRIIKSDHPSPLVRARHPDRWRAIANVWRTARQAQPTLPSPA
jgi:hypothetical protein